MAVSGFLGGSLGGAGALALELAAQAGEHVHSESGLPVGEERVVGDDERPLATSFGDALVLTAVAFYGGLAARRRLGLSFEDLVLGVTGVLSSVFVGLLASAFARAWVGYHQAGYLWTHALANHVALAYTGFAGGIVMLLRRAERMSPSHLRLLMSATAVGGVLGSVVNSLLEVYFIETRVDMFILFHRDLVFVDRSRLLVLWGIATVVVPVVAVKWKLGGRALWLIPIAYLFVAVGELLDVAWRFWTFSSVRDLRGHLYAVKWAQIWKLSDQRESFFFTLRWDLRFVGSGLKWALYLAVLTRAFAWVAGARSSTGEGGRRS